MFCFFYLYRHERHLKRQPYAKQSTVKFMSIFMNMSFLVVNTSIIFQVQLVKIKQIDEFCNLMDCVIL